jgi:hypothetical protein
MRNTYRIVSGATAHALAQNVNAAMADGYAPTGGVQYVVHEDHALWVQAVAVPAPQPVAGPTPPTGIETRGLQDATDGEQAKIARDNERARVTHHSSPGIDKPPSPLRARNPAQGCVRCDELKDDPAMRCPACPNKPRKAWQAPTLEKLHAQDVRQ